MDETGVSTPTTLAIPPRLSKDDVPMVVQRLLEGESLNQIAKDRVGWRMLYQWMLSGIGDQKYRDLVTDVLCARVADADLELLNASDKVNVARARELTRFMRFDLERKRPAEYGPKQHVQEDKTVTIIVNRGVDTSQPLDVIPFSKSE